MVLAHGQGSGFSGDRGGGTEFKFRRGRREGTRSPQQVLCEDGCSPRDSSAQSRAGGTRPARPCQLLAKPVPSGDARGRGQWEGSISDIGLLTVQERERLRVGKEEIESQSDRLGESQR